MPPAKVGNREGRARSGPETTSPVAASPPPPQWPYVTRDVAPSLVARVSSDRRADALRATKGAAAAVITRGDPTEEDPMDAATWRASDAGAVESSRRAARRWINLPAVRTRPGGMCCALCAAACVGDDASDDAGLRADVDASTWTTPPPAGGSSRRQCVVCESSRPVVLTRRLASASARANGV